MALVSQAASFGARSRRLVWWGSAVRGPEPPLLVPAPPGIQTPTHLSRELPWQLHSRADWRRPLSSSSWFSSCHLPWPHLRAPEDRAWAMLPAPRARATCPLNLTLTWGSGANRGGCGWGWWTVHMTWGLDMPGL